MFEQSPGISQAFVCLAVIGTAGRVAAISLGIVAALIAITLFIASRTKWGQSKPLTQCIALAVLAHVWLLMYAYGTRVQQPGRGPGNADYSNHEVSIIEFAMDPSLDSELQAPTTLEPALELPQLLETTESPKAEVDAVATQPEAPIETSAPPERPSPDSTAEESSDKSQGIDADISDLASSIETQQGLEQLDPNQNTAWQPSSTQDSGAMRTIGRATISVPAQRRATDQQLVPDVYQLRFSESRSQIASQLGGDASTEAAVEASLRWLSSIQEADGSWNAAKYGAGRETHTLERDRQGTGSKSDTGMTALALLSFLGAGYTQDRGPYPEVVARGLDYLTKEQMPSGDLAGKKQIGSGGDVLYARMYCHGMATLALAEAYSMTGDQRLLYAIQRAAGYTLKAQNPQTGGWRYQFQVTGDPGDLSQFGWQAMALSSCERAGVRLPTGTHSRLAKFLDSVASGRYGGLAVYRPVPGQSPTTAMTAEGLAMRALLNYPLTTAGQQEANRMLLQHLPGSSEENLYYWYYATLALFQQQDESWRVWNEALKTHLTSTQVVSGPATGSWDPLCIWSGYGGRIYSTTMSCLCLEVYYRYLPIYQTSRMANQLDSGRR